MLAHAAPPGPRQRVPGLQLLAMRRDPTGFLLGLARDYGPIVQLRLAGRNHDALARATREGDQVRVTADLALVARPPSPIGRQ